MASALLIQSKAPAPLHGVMSPTTGPGTPSRVSLSPSECNGDFIWLAGAAASSFTLISTKSWSFRSNPILHLCWGPAQWEGALMWLHPKLEVVLALIRAKRAASSIRVPSEISMRGTISAALISPLLPLAWFPGAVAVELCSCVKALLPCSAGPSKQLSCHWGIEWGYRFILQFLPGFANLGDLAVSTRKHRFCVLSSARPGN